MPNGPTFIIDHSQRGDRNDQERSDVSFYQGPAPHGIYHRFQSNDRGIIGDDIASFPTTGGELRIPHQDIQRMGTGRATGRGKPTIDETTFVPGWAVGDPR